MFLLLDFLKYLVINKKLQINFSETVILYVNLHYFQSRIDPQKHREPDHSTFIGEFLRMVIKELAHSIHILTIMPQALHPL